MLRELHGEKLSKMEEEKRKRMDKFSKLKTGEEERKMKKQKEARKQISRYNYLPVVQPIYLSTFPAFYLPTYQSIYHLFIYLSIGLLTFYLPTYLRIYKSIFLSFFPT